MSPVSIVLGRAELKWGRKKLISSWFQIRSLFPISTPLEITKSKSWENLDRYLYRTP